MEQNIITEPKNISSLIINYFKVFFQNYKLLVAFNVLVLIGFCFFSDQLEQINFSENYVWNYINKSLYYFLYFTIPVSFIYTFFLTFTKNKPATFKNMIDIFLGHYVKILVPVALLCIVIFTFNFAVKSELMMYQLQDAFTFLFIEILNCIIYFFVCISLLHFTPYQTQFKKYFNNKLLKYLLLMFILLMISIFLYRVSFNVIILVLDIFGEAITELQSDYLYKYGSIAVEYCNTVATVTILIYTYFTFTSESKNNFQINEINQISGLNNDKDEEF